MKTLLTLLFILLLLLAIGIVWVEDKEGNFKSKTPI